MANIGINGFGRIGRMFLRAALERGACVTAINNPGISPSYLAYLFKFDSTHGVFKDSVCITDDKLEVQGQKIALYFEKEAERICWKDHEVDYVAECSGEYTTIEKACKHFYGGAKKVIISAPSRDAPMFVCGVNLECYKPCMKVISNTSCTTNCLAPLAKILHNNFEITEGFATAVHAVTTKQPTLDHMKADWRIGRSGAVNIIPTTTGAAKSIGKVIPDLDGRLNGMAFRVPVKNVCALDFTVTLKEDTDLQCIREKIKAASDGEMKGIIGFTDDEVVSTDFNGVTLSCVYDSKASMALGKKFFKIIAWYDNEMAYAHRLLDLIMYIMQVDKKYEEEQAKKKKDSAKC